MLAHVAQETPGTTLAAFRRPRLHGRMCASRPDANQGSSPEFADLVQAVARNRDVSAFERLFAHYAPRVKAYFRKLGTDERTAEELMQDVMLTLWRRAHLFDRTKAGVGTWIFAVARNRRIDAIRRERRPEIDPTDPMLVRIGDEGPDTQFANCQTEQVLRRAVATLPPEQAELVRRSFFDDMSHGAIADKLNLPLGTVKSRLRLALAKLRIALGNEP